MEVCGDGGAWLELAGEDVGMVGDDGEAVGGADECRREGGAGG